MEAVINGHRFLSDRLARLILDKEEVPNVSSRTADEQLSNHPASCSRRSRANLPLVALSAPT